jgi:hypothetical protein
VWWLSLRVSLTELRNTQRSGEALLQHVCEKVSRGWQMIWWTECRVSSLRVCISSNEPGTRQNRNAENDDIFSSGHGTYNFSPVFGHHNFGFSSLWTPTLTTVMPWTIKYLALDWEFYRWVSWFLGWTEPHYQHSRVFTWPMMEISGLYNDTSQF